MTPKKKKHTLVLKLDFTNEMEALYFDKRVPWVRKLLGYERTLPREVRCGKGCAYVLENSVHHQDR